MTQRELDVVEVCKSFVLNQSLFFVRQVDVAINGSLTRLLIAHLLYESPLSCLFVSIWQSLELFLVEIKSLLAIWVDLELCEKCLKFLFRSCFVLTLLNCFPSERQQLRLVVSEVWVQEEVDRRTVRRQAHKVWSIAKVNLSNASRPYWFILTIALEGAEVASRRIVGKEFGQAFFR